MLKMLHLSNAHSFLKTDFSRVGFQSFIPFITSDFFAYNPTPLTPSLLLACFPLYPSFFFKIIFMWTIFKVFIELLLYCFCFIFWLFGQSVCGY